ncbi:MAG: UDP-N-acetylmuramoyl-tripeptide--D-alanyl-D-alanine ligase [Chitinophagaceae bacterium]|nr:UDP-N-acetylmuramoyl-tripeptide--D-alanyl-D-alanine ligase [Chitinophagaceae bacterium]
MNTEQLYLLYKEHPSVCIDSRKVQPGDLFFALRGERADGNTFAGQALEAGAAAAVIDHPDYHIPGKTILVENTLKALQDLATCHRKQFSIPFLAIGGSNGKTTTKELIHAVLSTQFKTYTTPGNLNNHIGIPLTLLRIRDDAEMAVVEMGANHLNEITFYCSMAQPTHGLITNCGKDHLEGFGSEEGVKKANGELFDYLKTHQGVAFVMNDYDYLVQMSRGIESVFSYGTKEADIVGKVSESDLFLHVEIEKGGEIKKIQTRLIGEFNLPNVLAAVAVGKYFRITDENIKNAIEGYTPANNRSQLVIRGSNTFILDAYNANPSSMKEAIESFARMKASRKVVMLGAMAELGDYSIAEHQQIVNLLQQYTWDAVVLVGGDFSKTTHPFLYFDTAQEARKWLNEKKPENAFILLKGSRTAAMETVLTEE